MASFGLISVFQNDKSKIHKVIDELDEKKKETLQITWQKVNKWVFPFMYEMFLELWYSRTTVNFDLWTWIGTLVPYFLHFFRELWPSLYPLKEETSWMGWKSVLDLAVYGNNLYLS